MAKVECEEPKINTELEDLDEMPIKKSPRKRNELNEKFGLWAY